MKTIYKTILTVAGVVISILFIIWFVKLWIGNSKFKRNENEYHRKIESLKIENKRAYVIIDSLETVMYNDSIENAKAININADQFKYFNAKIREYEKAISNISSMSDAALWDSIAGYYHRWYGYN